MNEHEFGVDIPERQQAQQAQRRMDELFRALIENALDVITILDAEAEGVIRYQSPAVERVLGYKPAELIGVNIVELLHPDDAPKVHAAIKAAAPPDGTPGTALVVEARFRHKDGSWRILESIGKELPGIPSVTGIVVNSRDITDRKRAEEERQAHLRFFESMDQVNRAIQGTRDLEKLMSDVLATMLSIFDCDRSWLLYPCDPDAPSFRVPMEITKPEYPGAKILNADVPMAPGEAQNMREALESDAPVTYTAGTERPITTAKQFGVQSQMFVPVYPKLGKPWVFGMHQCSYPRVWTQEDKKLFQEIGRRLEDALSSLLAYRDLRENEEKYRAIIEQSSEGVALINESGNIVEWNQANERMTGLMRNQVIGLPLWDVTILTMAPERGTAQRRDALKSAVREALQTGKSYLFARPIEAEFCPQLGKEKHYLHQTLFPIKTEKGYRIASLTHDITESKRAEEALYEQQQVFRTLVENSPDIIARYDRDCRRTYVNPAYLKVAQIPRQKLLATSPTQHSPLPAASAVILQNLLRKVLDSGVADGVDVIWPKADNIDYWYNVYASPEFDREGRVVSVMTVSRDITERKRAEEALRVAEGKYRSIFENAIEGIFQSTPEGRFLTLNPVFARMLGYASPEEMIATITDISRQVYEESPRRAEFMRLMAEQGSASGFEFKMKRKDGGVIWVSENARTVRDADGTLLYYEGTTEDITERKRAEEASAQERNLLRTLIDNLPDYIYVKDVEGRFVLGNLAIARSFGKSTADEIYGKTDLDFHPPELAQQYYTDEQELLRSGQPLINREELVVEATGEHRWVLTTKVPLRDRNAKVVRLVGIGHDMTERKQAEDRLRETLADLERSNADLQQFAYVASHDLQEPLRMVASYVQLLGIRYQGQLDADADEFIGYAVEGAKRMQQLILDLLEYSRIGTRGGPRQTTDATVVCQAAIQDFEIAIAENNATVVCDPLPTVLVDASQLRQLFQNLIANAIKFHGAEPPQVHISAQLRSAECGVPSAESIPQSAIGNPQSEWEFAVRDNGIGIAPAYFERIFVIFQRLHTRDAYPGNGIGLAVCKRIIERHGGRIWVESAPGQGSTFFFTLPPAGGLAAGPRPGGADPAHPRN